MTTSNVMTLKISRPDGPLIYCKTFSTTTLSTPTLRLTEHGVLRIDGYDEIFFDKLILELEGGPLSRNKSP